MIFYILVSIYLLSIWPAYMTTKFVHQDTKSGLAEPKWTKGERLVTILLALCPVINLLILISASIMVLSILASRWDDEASW